MSKDAKEMMTIFIKIPVSHHKALVDLAAREERSLAGQVRFALKTMLYTSDLGDVDPEDDE